MNILDIRTLALTSVLVSLVMSAYMLHFQRTRKTYPGFGWWALGSLMVGPGMLLLGLRGSLPAWLSVVAVNLLLNGSLTVTYVGMALFFGRPARWPAHAAILTLATLATMHLTYQRPDVPGRMIVASLYIVVYSAASIALALREGRPWPLATLALPMASWGMLGLFHLARGLYLLLARPSIADFLAAGPWQAISLLLGPMVQILIPTGLISLTNLKLEQEVAQARQEVLTLSGLLPICSHCKRIRDDKGYWQQVEVYVKRHSQADFSHGICPQCLRELYPDYADEVLARTGPSRGMTPPRPGETPPAGGPTAP